jgi:hypothetical protein
MVPPALARLSVEVGMRPWVHVRFMYDLSCMLSDCVISPIAAFAMLAVTHTQVTFAHSCANAELQRVLTLCQTATTVSTSMLHIATNATGQLCMHEEALEKHLTSHQPGWRTVRKVKLIRGCRTPARLGMACCHFA